MFKRLLLLVIISVVLPISQTISALTITPQTPTGVTVPTTNSTGSFSLTWSTTPGLHISSGRYFIEQSFNNGAYQAVTNVTSATRSFALTNKQGGVYRYSIKACNVDSLSSSGYKCSGWGYSGDVSVNSVPSTPAAPTGPSAVNVNSFTIAWVKPSGTVSNYTLQERVNTGTWTTIVGSTSALSYSLSNKSNGVWDYQVRACNSAGCSAYSAYKRVTVQVNLGDIIPDQALVTPNVPSQQAVGAVEGQASVSGGAASYNIPIALPPGRAGIQPSVSLNYSSRGGNGIAGVGWSLSAGSSIHRCAQTVAQDNYFVDVNYSTSDRLCLDGQRLVVTNGQTYGTANTEYRTELDSFSRVTQKSSGINNTSTWFEVEHKNGEVSSYGLNSNSKQIAAGRSETLSWSISGSSDRSGNKINYSYTNYGEGEHLLARINYTGYGSVEGNRKVVFDYENRVDDNSDNDYQISFQAGGKTSQTKRLASIKTYINYTLIRNYTLNFGDMSLSSGRTLLRSIEECAYKNGNKSCLPETSFNWQEGATQFDLLDLNNATAGYYVNLMRESGDFDGDGRKEYVMRKVKKIALPTLPPIISLVSFDAQGNQIERDITSVIGTDNYSSARMWSLVNKLHDWDNDGRADLMHYNALGQLVVSKVNLTPTSAELVTIFTFNTISTEPNPVFNSDNVEVEPGMHSPVYIHPIDFNNDGLMDLWRQQLSHNNQQINYNVYFNTGTSQIPKFSETNKVTVKSFARTNYHPSSAYNDDTSLVFGDLNGDGLIDLTASQAVCEGGQVLDKIWINQGQNQFVESTWSALGIANNNLPQDTYHLWADINGDGLEDYLFVPNGLNSSNNSSATWRYQLNSGDGYEAPVDTYQNLGLAGFGGRGQADIPGSSSLCNSRASLSPQYTPRFASVIYANDYNGDGSADLMLPTQKEPELRYCRLMDEGKQAWPKENDNTYFDDLLNSCANLNIEYGELYAKGLGHFDRSLYKTKAYSFKYINGKYQLKLIPGSEQITRANSNHAVDPFGDGLTDYVFEVGKNDPLRRYNYSWAAGTSKGPGMYLYRSKGASSDSNNPKLPDVMSDVENGMGVKARWNYSPLTSSENRGDNIPDLYTVPQNDEARVIDKEHFYFKSSMYVVSSLEQSNGIGGDNQTFYSYSDAIYNNKGRGFQGFRKIVVDDIERNTRSISVFNQSFPLAGNIQSTRSCFISSDENCDNSALNKTTIEYEFKNTVTVNDKIYWVIPTSTTTESFDPTDYYNPTSEKISLINKYETDNYGNVLKSVTTVNNGFSVIKSTTQNIYYPANETDWWINKLNYSLQTNETLSNTPLYKSALDPIKRVRTTYTWATNRQPDIITVTPELGGGKTVSTNTDYNDYGLPIKVTTSSSGETSRYVNMGYSNDDYFVNKTTNMLNQSSYIETNPIHGQPDSTRDINGFVSYFDYDAFGRIEKASPPVGTGQPVYSRFGWCNSNCEGIDNAVYKLTTYSAGTPQSTVYKDQFNRDLVTKSQQFNGSPVYRFVKFNALGQKTFESIPTVSLYETDGTYFNGYDELGRLTSKTVSQTNGQVMNVEYNYGVDTPFQTEIRVNNNPPMYRTYSGTGQLMQTTDANGGLTRYVYDGTGNPIVLEDANGNPIEATYNALGQKLWVKDPNMGLKTFTYTGFGEVLTEKDANLVTTKYQYDGLGRLDKRYVNNLLEATFIFDLNGCKGTLTTETVNRAAENYSLLHEYDNYCRPKNDISSIDNDSYKVSYYYDANYGRIKGKSYPDELTVQYIYNNTGYLDITKNPVSNIVYRDISTSDIMGNWTKAYQSNNTMNINREFHLETGQMKESTLRKGGTLQQLINYDYEAMGNLIKMAVGSATYTDNETYAYDNLQRLITSTRRFSNSQTDQYNYQYDAVGNFTYKSDFSLPSANYIYGNLAKNGGGLAGPNAARRVTLNNGKGYRYYTYDNNGNMTNDGTRAYSYNAFNKPTQITTSSGQLINPYDTQSTTTNTLKFYYGADQMRYKQIKTMSGETTTTIYIGKMYEEIKKGSTVTKKSYVDDIAVVTRVGTSTTLTTDYVHRDRLGSMIASVKANGDMIKSHTYDPFGKPRDGKLNDSKSSSALGDNKLNDPTTTRGFTDHEHLDDAQLIHMNGRVYDYNLGRFLSVDPFIQEPGNSQSMNPYSYIMNNPLAGTDPSGYKSICNGNPACKTIWMDSGGNNGLSEDTTKWGGGNGNNVNQSVEANIINDVPIENINNISSTLLGNNNENTPALEVGAVTGSTNVNSGAGASAVLPALVGTGVAAAQSESIGSALAWIGGRLLGIAAAAIIPTEMGDPNAHPDHVANMEAAKENIIAAESAKQEIRRPTTAVMEKTLADAGFAKPGPGYSPHHIVPIFGFKNLQGGLVTDGMRDLLSTNNIGINSAENLIWLPNTDAARIPGDISILHGTGHRFDTILGVNQRIQIGAAAGGSAGVSAALGSIRADFNAGISY